MFSFLIMGLWMLVADKLGEGEKSPRGLDITALLLIAMGAFSLHQALQALIERGPNRVAL